MSLIFDLEEADARRLFPPPWQRRTAFTPLPPPTTREAATRPILRTAKRDKSRAPAAAARRIASPAPESDLRSVQPRRWTPRRCRRLWIEPDTGIAPAILAHFVCQEVSQWLGVELPRSWEVRLAVKADVVYHHNRRFRQGVRRSGWYGVDYLRMFMRHWLADRLHRHRPDWHARLPSNFCRGADLPERVLADRSQAKRPGHGLHEPSRRGMIAVEGSTV